MPLTIPSPSLPALDHPTLHILKGRESILRLAPQLAAFANLCDQPGAMHDLPYFLSKPGALPRTPWLLLFRSSTQPHDLNPEAPSQTLDPASLAPEDLLGILLIYEFRPAGLPTRAFATNDRSGRNTLIARPHHRARVAALASRTLLDHFAQLILISCRLDPETPLFLHPPPGGQPTALWALRERVIPAYLPLLHSYDATLATIGQRTRSNLRYYRRRAESRLGCTFFPNVEVTRDELLRFNQDCMYPVPKAIAAWRHAALRELADPIFMGIKTDTRDRSSPWLSILGGRRIGSHSEILWQLNRAGHPSDSLGTVMRSYLLEHEINRGATRLYVEGGTTHPIHHSFVHETLTDLVITRRSAAARLMQSYARHSISPDNELSQTLAAPNLHWHPC